MDELLRRADALMGQERWEEAESLFLSEKQAAAERGFSERELSLCSELLGFYRMRGDAARFWEIWTRTKELLASLRLTGRARGTFLINAATGMVAFGEAREALALFDEAEACFRRGLPRGDLLFAALYNNMASACEALGDYAAAERRYKLAGEILDGYPGHPDKGTYYVNLAQLYARQDRGDPRVGECLTHAMEVFDDPQTVWDGYYAHTVRKCAGAFRDLGYAPEGAELEERAALIYEGT